MSLLLLCLAYLLQLTAHGLSAEAYDKERKLLGTCHDEDRLHMSIRAPAMLQAAVGMQPRANAGISATNSGGKLRACIQEYASGLDSVKSGLGDYIRNVKLEAAARSEKAMFFGAGSGTTGTRSLHAALETLGLNGWHYNTNSTWTESLLHTLHRCHTEEARSNCHETLEAFDYTSIPDDVDYVLDEPTDQLFLHLFLSYPNAKFILTTRPLLKWVERRRKHTWTLAPILDPCGEHVEGFPDDKDLARLEDLKRQLVRCVVPKKRLLEFSLFESTEEQKLEFLPQLASFLGRPCPANTTFPWMSARAHWKLSDKHSKLAE